MKKVDFSKMTPNEIIAHFGGVSVAIRELDRMKYERGQIAKMLEKRYQHVRNVLITPVKNPKQTKVIEISDQFKKDMEDYC